MRKFALMAAVAAAPVSAHADWYGGAAYTNFDSSPAGGISGPEAKIGGITGRLGYRMNQNFAVEGEVSTGLGDDDGVELNYNAGIYAVGIIPLSSNLDLHGRVGVLSADIETPVDSFNDSGFGYGVGATWKLTDGFGIRGDFTRMEGSDVDADAISIGGVFNF